MPANTADEVLVGANGAVFVAPAGSTAPTTPTGDPGGAYVELGFLSENGVTMSDTKSITDIPAWQSFYPVRKIVSGRATSVAFALRQWNAHNVELAFGGGVVAPLGGGDFSYSPPDPEDIDERIVVVDWEDGDKNYRLVIPRCIVTNAVETNITRTAAADLPITLEAITDGSVDPYTLYTNDPSFADFSS